MDSISIQHLGARASTSINIQILKRKEKFTGRDITAMVISCIFDSANLYYAILLGLLVTKGVVNNTLSAMGYPGHSMIYLNQ